jgi:hypothetical protein
VNATATRTIPEILAHFGALTLEEADAEYWRRVDQFRDTDAAGKLWHHWERVKAIATGLSPEEAQVLEDAVAAWGRAQPLDPEWERREREHMAELLAGEQICGACGGTFGSLGELIAHQSYCGFMHPTVSVESLIRQ